MINQKNQIIIIASCSIIAILAGLIFTFFGSIISSLNNNKNLQNAKSILKNQKLKKWVLMGCILNFLIFLNWFVLMKMQLSRGEKGEEGITGNQGEPGEKGNDSATCFEC